MLSEEVKFREFAFLSAWWNQSHTPLVARRHAAPAVLSGWLPEEAAAQPLLKRQVVAHLVPPTAASPVP